MKKAAVFLFFLCLGCKHSPNAPAVHIRMVNNNRSVEFMGMDYAVISDINRDSLQAMWQSLLPVYRMPPDTDLKNYQPVQPGVYQLKDSAVVFTPDTPFAQNKTYFMRYYKFDEGDDLWAYIKNKKKLGSTPYVDLVFK